MFLNGIIYCQLEDNVCESDRCVHMQICTQGIKASISLVSSRVRLNGHSPLRAHLF